MRLAHLKWLPIAVAAGFYAAFIARSSVQFRGRPVFALIDDAAISMTYGRDLAHGHGLVWTDGHKVEGYSNLLWTLWMAVVHLFPFSDRTAGLPVMISSALLLLAAVWLAGRLCAELSPRQPAIELAAMLLVGLYYPLAFWSLRGMEVGMAALLVLAMVLLAVQLRRAFDPRRAVALGVVMAAAVLTRDELLIHCILVSAYLLWLVPRADRKRVALYSVLPLVLAVGGHVAYRLVYYGDALPNTYYLKLTGMPLGSRVGRGLLALGHTGIVTLYAPVLMAAAYLVIARRRLSPGAVLIALMFVAQCGYSVWVGGDFIEQLQFANRYVATAAPLLMVLAALGIGEVIDWLPSRRWWTLVVVFVGAGALVAFDWLPTKRIQFEPVAGVHWWRVAVALAIAAALAVAAATLRRMTGARARVARTATAVVLALLVLLQVDRQPGHEWVSNGVQGIRTDSSFAEYGLIIRSHTAPNTGVAMVAAGNTAYFAHRPGVDLLGKMDPVIAHGKSHPGAHQPGHTKWNYAYSIGRLRPQVVVNLFFPTHRDLCDMVHWGYRQVAPDLYVLRRASGVETASLGADITALHARPPDAAPHNCA